MVRLTVECARSFASGRPWASLHGTPLRRHEPPLIMDLGEFLLRDVVEKHIAAENRFDPGQFPCRQRFERQTAGDLAHVEFVRPPER
jgi:hypothetical protein